VSPRLHTGTSGFSYKEWKGPFYPDKLPAKRFLEHYASRLSTVEVNNTFYRMPREELFTGWVAQVGEGFRFAVKAPQRITHRARLVDCGELVQQLWSVCGALGPHLGPLLFQLPPFFKCDHAVLRDFLAALPAGCRAAFEFRNPSWFDDEVYALLHAAGAALVIADSDRERPPTVVATAGWGYLRLRREDYVEQDLDLWAERIRAAGWDEACCYFKHEDAGVGPRLALSLAQRFE
jgi:uncharacterized protein YecE (DUF72 family)